LIKRTLYIEGISFDPYRNLALEETLLDAVPENGIILYLWQNSHTIVIGRNQNPWKECRVRLFEEEGGRLVRRISGGGAVYHDMGNLNFTFLTNNEDYDIDRQLSVITRAVAKFGIHAQKSGRNDITIDGSKFSGNAFYKNKKTAYHHGTILLDVDGEKLSRYLTVSEAKIKSKGVDSVRSRVTCLKKHAPSIDIETLKKSMKESFLEVYGTENLEMLDLKSLPQGRIEELTEKYSSDEFRLGTDKSFGFEMSKRFPWGEISVGITTAGEVIEDAEVYSDAMDAEIFSEIKEAVKRSTFNGREIADEIKKIKAFDETKKTIIDDVAFMFLKSEI